MPTYEYHCEKCGKEFEVEQKITAEPLQQCPVSGCGGKIARMINGGGGFILKGTGWYATDYKKKPVESASGKVDAPKSETKASPDSSSGSVTPKSDPAPSQKAKDTKKA